MSVMRKCSTKWLGAALALAMAFACLSAATLLGASKAWAAEGNTTIWATTYEKNGEYTLAIQATSAQESAYGSMVEQKQMTLSESDWHLAPEVDHSSILDQVSVKAPQRVVFIGGVKAPTMNGFFFGAYYLKQVDLRGLDTSEVTSMNQTFDGCSGLTSLDLSGLDTSKVTNMNYMFADCSGLASLDLSRLDTSKVTSMDCMFAGCSGLASLDLSRLDTSKVTSMDLMFDGCSGLASLDLSRLDTSKVTSMNQTFYNCSGLASLDLSRLDTSKVTSMNYMFAGCSGLASLDLSRLDTSKVTSMAGMFRNCSSLAALDLSALNMSQVASFQGFLTGAKNLKSITLGIGDRIDGSGICPFEDPRSLVAENPAIVKVTLNEKLYKDGIVSTFTATALKAGATKLKMSGDQWSYELNVIVKGTSAKPGAASAASLANATVTVKERAWTGKKLAPASVTVKLNGKTLKKGTDYTVSCKGGKAVGAYKVTVTGKGSYTGAKAAEFRIVPKAVSGAKAKGAKRSVKVTWKAPSKAARSQVTGYQVRCSASKSMKDAVTVKVKGASKTSATLTKAKDGKKTKKLKAGKKYYVQVRAYKTVKGKTYYSAWSKAKAVKTKK